MPPLTPTPRVHKAGFAGFFLLALATLMYEVLLTRIFSVTMLYHFAFVAISLAMFGMTAGAVLVYLAPKRFVPERAKHHLAVSSLSFACTVVLTFFVHLHIPVDPDPLTGDLVSLPLTYVVISIPFVMSGICTCVALTRFPGQVSRLYAADLIGAASGCFVLVCALRYTDGPTAVILAALIAAIGAVLFAREAGSVPLTRSSILASVLLAALTVANTGVGGEHLRWLRLKWVKGQAEAPALYERWNSFSRVRVEGNPEARQAPFGYGLSPSFRNERKVRSLYMSIDAGAGTPIAGFDGLGDDLEYLRQDITSLAHYLRSDASVLIVGTGGGRDVLSALAFHQKSVLGVELNDSVLDALNRQFGEFSGHLDKDRRVTFVNDEARSYVARLDKKFDIFQVSFIDTWAATAAGAFVLSENSLYTTEAWTTFLERLSPRGLLTFSRWYFRDRPGEMYRVTALASAALKQRGVAHPRDHIVIARLMSRWQNHPVLTGIGTILVGRDPFSEADLDRISKVTDAMQFEIVLSPRVALDETFATIASGENTDAFIDGFPINIAAPTDDSPFFFNMLRLRDVFNAHRVYQGAISHNMKAVRILGLLLLVVVALTLLCIIVPLWWTTKKSSLQGALPLFLFFASIGLGFMLIEISQMQRLIIFLGHPTYGLTVVLVTLLLSSGAGSYLTGAIDLDRAGARWLGALLAALIVFGVITPRVIVALQSASTPLRIGAAACMLAPVGLLMGVAFPLGIRRSFQTDKAHLTPWLWGVNGATSVCASVVAVAITLVFGIAAAFWTGFAFYGLAWCAFAWSRPTA